MEWIAAVQKSINYMESHMLDNIDYDEIAAVVNISNFHFHSSFSLIVGMTANEYLRKRRLSMAGQELCMSDAKVIDVAYKYGYDSPESFSKAFSRFHGISPNQARLSGAKLTLFNPMKIKIIVEGGNVMDYRIEQRETFYVLAKTKAFLNEKINEEGNHDIPDFWDKCLSDGTFDLLAKNRLNLDNYSVCSPVSPEKESFNYSVGVLCNEDTKVPGGFEKIMVNQGMWAVFQCFGNNGDCMDGVWKKIYSEFLPQSGYEIRNYSDFEYYPSDRGNLFCEIWVPVQKKQ